MNDIEFSFDEIDGVLVERYKEIEDRNEAENNEAENEEESRNNLVKLTLRLEKDVVDAIDEIADSYGLNRTAVLRLIMSNRLKKVMSGIRYIDRDQAREIRDLIREAADQMSQIKRQLRFIGNNYNQEIKIQNIRRKYGKLSELSVDRVYEMKEEIEKAESEGSALSMDDINDILDRFDESARKWGEELWLLRG